MLSSLDFFLPFFVLRVILAFKNRKGSSLTLNVKLTLCELFDDNVVDDGVFTVLAHLFQACITFLL